MESSLLATAEDDTFDFLTSLIASFLEDIPSLQDHNDLGDMDFSIVADVPFDYMDLDEEPFDDIDTDEELLDEMDLDEEPLDEMELDEVLLDYMDLD